MKIYYDILKIDLCTKEELLNIKSVKNFFSKNEIREIKYLYISGDIVKNLDVFEEIVFSIMERSINVSKFFVYTKGDVLNKKVIDLVNTLDTYLSVVNSDKYIGSYFYVEKDTNYDYVLVPSYIDENQKVLASSEYYDTPYRLHISFNEIKENGDLYNTEYIGNINDNSVNELYNQIKRVRS